MSPRGAQDTAVQRGRARQYALCTIAVGYDRVSDGVEGVFDQALTNGLAAIVAHTWPGNEIEGQRVRSAAGLLEVVKAKGESREPGVWHVPHEPADQEHGPTLLEARQTGDVTPVRVEVLHTAIKATQAIRHARDTGQHTGAVLTADHVDALEELDWHPALRTVMDELQGRHEAAVPAADRAERRRATEYLFLLGDEEVQRRAAIDYASLHRPHHKDDETTVEDCPVCDNLSLVAENHDGLLAEIGIGQCVICSYQRTAEAASAQAQTLQIRRAMDRPG
ncbi:hypothetical protein [Actinomadura sp. 3N407]|uniref:hypothetical protein n=1 Tax=Actinomadura sp. 3N407 TaxID=3457423 RepID=UPI003FCC426A